MEENIVKYIIYILFMIFNVILGLSGLSLIGGGIYYIVKTEFNQYIIIIIGLGVIIAAIFALGFFTWKKTRIVFIYMILIIIIFIIEISLVFVIKFHKDTNDYIRNHIKDIIEVTEEEQDKIINVSIIIISIASACSFLSFILAFLYYKKLKDKTSKLIEDKNEDDYMKGLDYTSLNPDSSTV